jgi:hypothetical protein
MAMNDRAPVDEAPRHPAAHALEAVAAGDADAAVESHLAVCAVCREHVRALREEVARFRSEQGGEEFVKRVRSVEAIRAKARRSGTLARIGYVAGPLLAAALVVLVVRGRPGDGGGAAGKAHGEPSAATPPVGTGESRFKGGLVVAAIRERGEQQERLVGAFEVRAGDRVRVEVSTDHEGPVAAGLLTDEGQWVTLFAPVALEAGTHYSELDARFDASPTHATLLAGDPAAVERARTTRDFTGVVAWRVTSEAAP